MKAAIYAAARAVVKKLITYVTLRAELRWTRKPTIIGGEEAWAKVRQRLPNLLFRPRDRLYRVCSLEQFKRIVKWDWLDQRKYQAEYFDCDDFATVFAARMRVLFGLNNVGVVYDDSSAHAYNVVLVTDSGFPYAALYEPQTDKFIVPGTTPYKGAAGWVIF